MDTYLNYANASPAQFGATFGGSYFNPLEGQSSNILDSIIGRRMENVEPMRAKIRKFYEQEQMQKQQKELADERDKQAKIGATVQAVKEGASLFEKPKAVETPEMGGGGAGIGAQSTANAAGRQEVQTSLAEDLGDTARQAESIHSQMGEAVKDQNLGKFEGLSEALKNVTGTGMGIYSLLNKENISPEDYTKLGLSSAGTIGSGTKLLGNYIGSPSLSSAGSTIGGAAGAAGSAMGLYEGARGIIENPKNPMNYINTAQSGYNLYNAGSQLFSPAASIAPEAMTTTATGQLSAPMAESAGTTVASGAGGAVLPGFSAGLAAPTVANMIHEGATENIGRIGTLGGTKHVKTKEDVGGGIAGAAAGAVAGAASTSWSGPGAIVGGVVGALAGAFGDDLFEGLFS